MKFNLPIFGVALLTLLASCSPIEPLKYTDVYTLDIDGFMLGMNIEDAKKINPKLRVKEIRPEGTAIIGYQAVSGNTRLFFTVEEFGSKLFNIQYVEVFKHKVNAEPIYQKYLDKYGLPDSSGRKMFDVNSCWGRCYGKYPTLTFTLKISNLTNKPFPLTVTLVDPKLQSKNQSLYNVNRRKKQ